MDRLRHSFAGYLRLMQVSSTNLFVFVEGKQSDPYFYARICGSTPGLGSSYKISIAEQLPGGAGGKQRLLGFFTFLRNRRKLVSSLAGQKTTSIFFVDKDVDDLHRKKKRSPHLVYTEHYDVQNYIFLHGDLQTGVASAASVDPARLNVQFRDGAEWCLRTAKLWREWISICLRMLEDGISCQANYRVASQVQARPSGPTDAGLYATFTINIARGAGLPVSELRQRLASTTEKVDRYFSQSMHHRIFKGKWFADILADEVDQIMAGQTYDKKGLSNRLPSAITATLDFREPWADYFRNAIQSVIELP